MKSSERDNLRIYLDLFVFSFLSLYAELLIVRWLSCDVRGFTVFRTFPLITCFVGLSAGLAVGQGKLFRYVLYAIAQLMITLKLAEFLGILSWHFPSIGISAWQSMEAGKNFISVVGIIGALVFILSGPFAICLCIGDKLGELFNQLPPLKAYAINLSGALAGSLVFALLSYTGLPPWMLLVGLAVACALYLIPEKANRIGTVLVLIGLPLIASISCEKQHPPLLESLEPYRSGPSTTFWSPYQRLDLTTFKNVDQFIAAELSVNRFFYQYYIDNQINLHNKAQEQIDQRRAYYRLPFELHPAKDVLIVGAGMGQNASAALETGSEHVDAVEIDPIIVRLGKKYNPVYSSDKVSVVCDDARHFFSTTNRKYDLISFSLLDSHAVAGQTGSIRLDTYVYTKESFEQALSLLKPNGKVVVSFNVYLPWMFEHLYYTLKAASGHAPITLHAKDHFGSSDSVFVVGNESEPLASVPKYMEVVSIPERQNARILTDDWPYLYVNPEILDIPYLSVVALVILLGANANRRILLQKKQASDGQMFFLGAAFLLLELHAIAFLALIYGATWLTSAIVINAVLLMILAANMLVIKAHKFFQGKETIAYILLAVSILASFALQPSSLAPGPFKYILVTIITVLPLFMAGIIFPLSFKNVANPARALSFNLLGSVIGGVIEYVSIFWGVKSLELLALCLYAVSFAFFIKNNGKQTATDMPDETLPS